MAWDSVGMSAPESGMIVAEGSANVWADDLANATTPGFTTAEPSSTDGVSEAAGLGMAGSQGSVTGTASVLSSGTVQSSSGQNLDPGPLVRGPSSDLGLTVPGYFPVRTPQGIAFTANGEFTRNSSGQLVTLSGAVLVGLNLRPVIVPQGGFALRNGAVVDSTGKTSAQLAVAVVPNPGGLARVAGGLLSTTPESGPAVLRPALGRDVVQGYYTGSNTSFIQSMAGLVTVQAQFLLSADAEKEDSAMAHTATTLPPQA